MAGESIVVVDDNPQNLKLARVVLAGEGFVVHEARDAAEALAVISAISPRLVLMDIQLPGTDGLELTRTLRADPAQSKLLIVAMTAYAMKGDRERVIAAGCDGYIAKPIDIEQLPRLVADFLAPAKR